MVLKKTIFKNPKMKVDDKMPTKKRSSKELLAILYRLFGFLTNGEKLKIMLGMTALSVNAVTNLSFPYILGQVCNEILI